MCRSAARKVRERSKEKKNRVIFKWIRVDDPCKHTILYPELQIERAGRRERGRGSATATGTSAGMADDLVASRRIGHEPVHAGVVGQVAHHDRIADAGRMEVLFLRTLPVYVCPPTT